MFSNVLNEAMEGGACSEKGSACQKIKELGKELWAMGSARVGKYLCGLVEAGRVPSFLGEANVGKRLD